jgi:hypothetical protein
VLLRRKLGRSDLTLTNPYTFDADRTAHSPDHDAVGSHLFDNPGPILSAQQRPRLMEP